MKTKSGWQAAVLGLLVYAALGGLCDAVAQAEMGGGMPPRQGLNAGLPVLQGLNGGMPALHSDDGVPVLQSFKDGEPTLEDLEKRLQANRLSGGVGTNGGLISNLIGPQPSGSPPLVNRPLPKMNRGSTELIPPIESVVVNLSPRIQALAWSDPRIAVCNQDTLAYRSALYGEQQADNQAAKKIITRHDTDCLKPFSPATATHATDEGFAAVGALYSVSGRDFYCTATLIEPNVIVTARHCAYVPVDANQAATEDAIEYRLDSPSDIEYSPVAQAGTRIAVSAFVDRAGTVLTLPATMPSFDQKNDVIFMRLKTAVAGVTPAAIGSKPPMAEQVVRIPGFYARLTTFDATASDGANWARYMRFDNLPTCRAILVGQQCIFHGCQTEPGWSGAPVFVDSGTGQWVVAGVQSGSLIDQSNCRSEVPQNKASRFGARTDIPNVAAMIPAN